MSFTTTPQSTAQDYPPAIAAGEVLDRRGHVAAGLEPLEQTPSFGGMGARALPQTVVTIGVPSPMLLHGLESLLRQTPGIRLGGATDSMTAFLANCVRANEGIALVDPSLSQMPIGDFLKMLKTSSPDMHVVLITDTHHPHQVREAVRHGACGLVAKTADVQEIQLAISAAAKGNRYISPTIAGSLAESLTLADLTQREMDVLGLLAQGHCNKLIARLLDITVGTVKTHVRSIMAKLHALSRTEAVRIAHRRGLVSFD